MDAGNSPGGAGDAQDSETRKLVDAIRQIGTVGRRPPPTTKSTNGEDDQAAPADADSWGDTDETPVFVPPASHSVTDMEEQLRTVSSTMGDNLTAIRQKILKSRATGQSEETALTEEEERRAYLELRKRHQVDLNDEGNLTGLEDRGLLSHMDEARRALAEQNKTQHPDQTVLRTGHVKTLRQFSTLVQTLTSANMELQCGVEETFLQANNAAKLSKGETPHAFPSVPGVKPTNAEALDLLKKKTDEAAKACQKSAESIASGINEIDVLRREYEKTIDGLTILVEFYKKSHTTLAELLADRTAVVGQ